MFSVNSPALGLYPPSEKLPGVFLGGFFSFDIQDDCLSCNKIHPTLSSFLKNNNQRIGLTVTILLMCYKLRHAVIPPHQTFVKVTPTDLLKCASPPSGSAMPSVVNVKAFVKM